MGKLVAIKIEPVVEVVPSGAAAYLDSVFQGDQPWVRQLRFKNAVPGRNVLGYLHLSPEMMIRDSLPLTWEDRDGNAY